MKPTHAHIGTPRLTALTLAAGLLAAGLVACGGDGDGDDDADAPVPVVVDTTPLRTATALDKLGWRFIQDDNLTEAAALSSDASTWSTVTLPHTWNEKDAASTEQTTPDSRNYKRGKGWYRLDFDHAGGGATQWLQFDGASIVADVWLNGEKLGQHRGAFSAFRFDVTGKLKAGNNVLVVRADNSEPMTAADPTAIAPLAGDFNMSGGLYRGVSLLATPNAAHFLLNEPVASKDADGNDVTQQVAGSGAYARTLSVTNGAATVSVNAKLKNASTADGSFTVQAALLDAAGNTATVAHKDGIAVAAGASIEVAQDLVVANAHLWQGMEDPYLYKLVVELKDGTGNAVDKLVQDFGIRTVTVDPNQGFFLNQKSVPLRGVSMHQDFQDKAWAIDPADTDLSLGLIKEIGANTIRLAHYPHASYTLQQADKLGFVIWAEVPFVNQALTAADCKTTSVVPVAFSANLKLQLQELIRQQYNHASIGMWSLANEIGNSGTCMGADTVTPVLRELQALAKEEDPGRLTTEADSTEQTPSSMGSAFGIAGLNTGGITDTWALNRYYGWYFGALADPATMAHFTEDLDLLHARYAQQPIGVSEYGAGAALSHHTDNVLGAEPCNFDTTGKTKVCYQPEEYANAVHEEAYRQIDKPYVWGTYVWNMFDFGSGIRHEGDIGGTNTKGLVTFDRRTKKDAFFFYKANWSKDPVTYIAARRYTERAYPMTDVKVYSNADSVALKVNGTTIATTPGADCAKKVCEFRNVVLQAGANSIEAEGSHGGRIVTDSATWNLSADNATNVYIAAGQLASGFTTSAGKRYGSDNFFSGGTGANVTPGISALLTGAGDLTPVKVGIGVNVADLAIYQAYRASNGMTPFSYEIPLANGTYTVRLGFFEPSNAVTVGGRVFAVEANGQTMLGNIDVLNEAVVYRTAIPPKTFSVTVADGKLNLTFKPTTGGAVVSNITVVKQ